MTPEKYKQLSIKEFTQAATIYDSGHAGIYEMCKNDYPPILAELEKESFHDVLDCGCGTGPMIQLLHEKYPDKHYVGLDLTPEMIHIAQAKKLSNSTYRVLKKDGRLILRDYTSSDFIVWLMNHLEMPLANLFGHGDVKIHKPAEFIAMAEKAGFTVLTMEKQKGFRAHLVARK